MLTRLVARGFKNLVDVDIHFGPFTCIAGPNGAGKSNLFDAISFLSHLSDKTFVDAARSIRGGDDLRALFTDPESGRIEFRAEMVIPPVGFDDFGQRAEASATFVYYELTLALESSEDGASRIRLEREELNYIAKAESPRRITFAHSKRWIDSVVKASARRTTFIQTDQDDRRGAVIRLQSDRMQGQDKTKRGGGSATGFSAVSLPRTVLSSAQNADEARTAVIVRNEMRSWRQLQLEPSALRSVDDFESPPRIDSSGKHVPSVLNRLSRDPRVADELYVRLANSLVSLVEDVRSVRVDRDESRRALRFMMKDKNGLELPAGSLSDGTMRFVALSVMEMDPDEGGVICLEEPENGIHPQRVNAMLDLLYRIASDADSEISFDNPLRQVIISTHSPAVVKHLDRDDVVFAVSESLVVANRRVRSVKFLGLPDSWRAKLGIGAISDGIAISYLKGLPLNSSPSTPERTVAARYWKQLQLPLDEVGEE
ncbi:AAA family ATPase [Pseudoxanthomonas mexicana]|uniref:AAA family ATPase n=1 Tax=Pseudoxanthomonas mexicana TaxID=128785 RepID=UPI001FD65411|nr:ATP-binding protein [Pseudoxanthomonas mexicana]UOV01496.1 AAA family ATPase [Pseudoxanthomonas mexicana]